MANIVFRRGVATPPNSTTIFKNAPLTNTEFDGNLRGLNDEIATKAPIASPTFTGVAIIPTATINGGNINNTVIGNTIPAAGSFTTVTSTITTGTPPLTVASTTKVTNLHADLVDGKTFATTQISGVLYASPTDANEITSTDGGTSGFLLQSNGIGAAPSWIAPNTVAGVDALYAANLKNGVSGNLAYQNGVSSTVFLTNGPADSVLTFSGTIPQWVTSLNLTGTISHNGLVFKTGTGIDQLFTFTTASLALSTAWVSTGISGTNLTTGSHIVQLSNASGSDMYTGYMSWHSANSTDNTKDEIVLNRAGTADGLSSTLYLRYSRTSAAAPVLEISSAASLSASTYTLKFRRVI